MRRELVSSSKFLSLVLRHQPEAIGLTLDAEGWADVEELLARCRERGPALTREALDEIVATNEKRRFALSEDGRRIRARQGHSVDVELGLPPVEPPETLYHGTVERFLDSIRAAGLVRGERTHVHLSADVETARQVGRRRGRPVVLTVAARALHERGAAFFLSENDVWLVEHVPPEFLTLAGDSPPDSPSGK